MISDILDNPNLYLLWQAPFAKQKIRPFLSAIESIDGYKVLDLGCGPGTNAKLFSRNEYIGIDLSDVYIKKAISKYPEKKFIVSDVSDKNWVNQITSKQDIIFVNSLLHHLNDEQVRKLFFNISEVMHPDGQIYIMDLVKPEKKGIPYFFAVNDRGKFARKLEEWEILFKEFFTCDSIKPYYLSLLGISMWEMVYIHGSKK